ncbi:MAG: ribonuclease III [Candidatus Aeolococcus gillhamiae]|uniref:Ribonuclease 3 n=1 Tax=Candidatus Aeolococcus gillhamiae TaxID=3127015 RepID=A0A2W5ZEZ8_9BACT|nr:MAG: ribonuclease III [Candidatus Dormibacter sp. RRmetagenome_bin12]
MAGFEALQERLGVRFRRLELLREAMTHASWNNERGEPSGPGRDNERLEYLGDAVLELVVGEYLFRRFPTYDEGQLTQLRAALVNTVSLARLGERLNLGETLLLGKGAAKTGARKLPSLLANAFEAMTGAIFLDQGYRVATRVFIQNIGDLADWTDENHKGRLQEVSQERTGLPPVYRVSAEGGPGHNRSYAAEAVVGGAVVGKGRGPTKQAAQQAAARAALDSLAKVPANAAARAAGAARQAARDVATEPARVRRRVAEVAADRGASAGSGRDRRSATATPTTEPGQGRKRGLLATLRAAADVIVGGRRDEVEPPPAPPAVPQPPPRKRTRRGHRGGRGRGAGTGSSPS